MRMRKFTDADKWCSDRAVWAMVPCMFFLASRKRKICYSDMAELLTSVLKEKIRHRLGTRNVGNLAGHFGRIFLEYEGRYKQIPSLNSLIVLKNTGIPSTGNDHYASAYLREKGSPLNLRGRHRKKQFEEIFNDIGDYRNWNSIHEEFKRNKAYPSIATTDKLTRKLKALEKQGDLKPF